MPGLTLALLLSATNAPAAGTELSGTIESVTLEGIVAAEVSWTVRPGARDSDLTLEVERVAIEGLAAPLERLRLHCPQWRFGEVRQSCAAAELDAQVGGHAVAAQVAWDVGPTDLRLSVAAGVYDGRLRITLAQDQAASRLEFLAEELNLKTLVEELALMPAQALAITAGRVSLDGRVGPEADGTEVAELEFRLSEFSFDSSDGTVAAAGLGLRGDARVAIGDGPLALELNVAFDDGEALYTPLYLLFDELPPFEIRAEARIDADGAITIPRFSLGDGESLALSGSATLAAGQVTELDAELSQLALPLAFERYLKTALESVGTFGLHPSGLVRARLELRDGALAHVSAALDAFSLEDEQGRFLVDALSGVIDYDAEGDSLDSRVDWNRIGYYALVIRAAGARFFAGGRQFRLLEPLFAPVLDGGMRIEELALTDIGMEEMAVDFQGEIEPISLELITRALDWPVLKGTLSGTVPRVRVRGGVGEVGGAIRLDVFDGDVVVDQVKLERVFGVLPTLAAEVEARGLDLKQMTGAFSFGEIEGRLDGSVHGLRLLNWEPVAFDLTLATPEGYKGRRKISQRAVDNLSSLGGGAQVLSQTVLKFFEKFSYRRLGLRCRLLDNVCRMSGVAPAPQGYYIVEGAGVPRINIIGFSTVVDWPQLIRRLKAATQSGAPTVE